MINWKQLLRYGVILGLVLVQTSITRVNWLIIVAVWLGLDQRWGEMFGWGLLLDLAAGERLGQSSGLFLLVGGGVYWLNSWLRWRVRSEDIHLRLE